MHICVTRGRWVNQLIFLIFSSRAQQSHCHFLCHISEGFVIQNIYHWLWEFARFQFQMDFGHIDNIATCSSFPLGQRFMCLHSTRKGAIIPRTFQVKFKFKSSHQCVWYIVITMMCHISWHLKSLVAQLLIKKYVHVNNKENTKAPY